MNLDDLEDVIYFIAPKETPFLQLRQSNLRRVGLRSGRSVRDRKRAIARAFFIESSKNYKPRHEWRFN